MDLKYITYRDNEGYHAFILFPATVPHSAFAHLNPGSAGFCAISCDENGQTKFDCRGQSVSLGGLKSREEKDSKLLSDIANI